MPQLRWPNQAPVQPRGAARLSRLSQAIALILLALSASQCVVDGALLEAMHPAHPVTPDPAPTTLTGSTEQAVGATVQILSADGSIHKGIQGTVGQDGVFSLTVDGASSLQEAVVQGSLGRRQLLAIIPELPAQPSVFAPARHYDLRDLSPGALTLGSNSTALTVLALASVRSQNRNLGSVPACAMNLALEQVNDGIIAGKTPATVAKMVAAILAAADAGATDGVLPFQWKSTGSILNPAFLSANPVDLDGDGTPDSSTAAFDSALQAAIATFSASGQLDPTQVRVIISTKIFASPKNANCESYDPHQWSPDLAASTLFLTGGIHKDTPACSDAVTTHCLTKAQVDAANAKMGNWVPNLVAMVDDGTHGDAVAGDGIFSVQLDLPWWPVDPLDPTGVGVRIAYKFTNGQSKQGWTDSEEFPGNERHLELVDVNGDGLITRFDAFADETTNKDKKNLLNPAHGGCGTNKWLADKPATGCFQSDSRERAADLDADCKVDAWPPTGSVTPLTLSCSTAP